MWRRSQLRVDGSGLLACPDEGRGADGVTLDKINAANAHHQRRTKRFLPTGNWSKETYDIDHSVLTDLVSKL